MNDGDKTLKKKEFYLWVEDKFNPLDRKVASIKGSLKVLIPLIIANLLAIVATVVMVVNGD